MNTGLQQNLAAADLVLTAEAIDKLNALVA